MKKHTSISILDAMADKHLFQPWFRGNSWNTWRVFLAALFALPMTPEQLATYRKHTGRSAAPDKPCREAWLCCGRRAGKSLIAATIAVYLAFFRDYTAFLAPGEVGTVMVVAADRKQARTILRYVRAFVRDIEMFSRMVTRELRESIEFSNRVVIEIHTASFRTIRGYSCVACVNDEISFFLGDEQSAEPAAEIIAAERPALATIPGAMLLSLSSPHARRGPLWDAFKSFYGKDDASALFWKADSRSMNSKLDQSIIAAAYEADPISAAAEYGAEFRSDCDAFVSREVIDACLVKGIVEMSRAEGVRYFGFVDPSGGSSDSMTLAIAHRVKLTGKVVLDVLRETKPPFSPENTVREYVATLKAYGISEVTGDRYAGEWPREHFRNGGIVYKPSEKTRSELYIELLPMLNSRRAFLLDNPRLISQLIGLERRASRSGAESIDHAPNGHDDLANSAAGALVLANSPEWDASGCFLTVNGVKVSDAVPQNLLTDPRIWKRPGGLR
ncbi:MAG: hypothetical protein ACRD4S_01685 [Candidatus Acidiferrales bacterium]